MVISTPVRVRPARGDDFGPLAAMLARAFYDDPVTSWFYPDAARRMKHARRFFGIRLRQLADQELIYTTEELSGAALWTLPGRWREDLRQSLMLLPMLPVLLPRIVRSTNAVREIERRHPVVPHFYLSVLGTEPEQQGGGIGSALLGPVLRRCDCDGVGAYLECSKEGNVEFYARQGFALTERLELPEGPPLWLMWREPLRRAGRPAGC
ncbi:MAG TPA: GNAT family N-acetyltransferase [Solirubrobacteraceae bacterium]|jgi:GNAT superfamily N-acetyltransferase|nr:GNAT family N-acetyltransferase [Solirubrobacteraceae bacterium]